MISFSLKIAILQSWRISATRSASVLCDLYLCYRISPKWVSLSECIIAEAVHNLSRSLMPGYFSRVTWLITTFLGYLIYDIASEWWRAICGNIIFPCLCDFRFFQPIISKFQTLTSDAWYNLFFALFSLKSRYFRKLKATGFSITSFERSENSTLAAVSLAW